MAERVWQKNPHWVPVIGPAHNDIEVIGFEPEHWHVGFRFLDARTKRRAAAKDIEGAEVYALPVSSIWPEDYESTSRNEAWSKNYGTVDVLYRP